MAHPGSTSHPSRPPHFRLAALALAVTRRSAFADTRFCGGPAQPTTPDDLANVKAISTLQ